MLQGLLVVGIIQDTAHAVLSELLSVGTYKVWSLTKDGH